MWNAPLDALMCPLQIINDIEPLSSMCQAVNTYFIYHPSNLKITWLAISQKLVYQLK